MAGAAALARLLDPVALEARLADARVRREAVLAAKAASAAEPEFDETRYLATLPGLAMRGAAVILTGLAGLYAVVAAGCLLLTPNLSAPEAYLLAAVPSLPAALPSAPSPATAGWPQPPSAPPLLVALAPAAAAAPHPVRLAGPLPARPLSGRPRSSARRRPRPHLGGYGGRGLRDPHGPRPRRRRARPGPRHGLEPAYPWSAARARCCPLPCSRTTRLGDPQGDVRRGIAPRRRGASVRRNVSLPLPDALPNVVRKWCATWRAT